MRALPILALLLSSSVAEAQWIKKFNFRQTSGYCTDGTDETYVIGDSYPTTRNSVTFGWTTVYGDRLRNRDATKCSRHAGVNLTDNGSVQTFRVDLPSTGTYRIRVAYGSATTGDTHYYKIRDDSTALRTCTAVTTTANQYGDANCTVRTSHTDWDSNNTAYEGSFSSQILIIQSAPDSALGGSSQLAHVSVEQVSTTSYLPVLQAIGAIR